MIFFNRNFQRLFFFLMIKYRQKLAFPSLPNSTLATVTHWLLSSCARAPLHPRPFSHTAPSPWNRFPCVICSLDSSFSTFMCVRIVYMHFTCMWVGCTCNYMHVPVEAWGWCQESPSMALPPYSLRQGLQSNPKLTNMTILTSQLALGVPYCYLMVSQMLPCPSDFDMGSDVPQACETSAVTTEPSPEPIYRTNSPLNTLFFFSLKCFLWACACVCVLWGEGTCWCHGEHVHARGQPLESVPSSHLSRVSGGQAPGVGGRFAWQAPLFTEPSHYWPSFIFIYFIWSLGGGQAVVEFAV